jgi:hypothetical protein
MSRANVQVNEMRLRVPGLTRAEGRWLGELVANRLAESSFGKRAQQIFVVNIDVSVRAGGPIKRLAEEIARGIVRKVR